MVTNDNSARRPQNGPTLGFGVGSDEEKGPVTEETLQQAVYYRVSFTTGATPPTFLGLSVYDFTSERLFSGKRFNSTLAIFP